MGVGNTRPALWAAGWARKKARMIAAPPGLVKFCAGGQRIAYTQARISAVEGQGGSQLLLYLSAATSLSR